MSSQRLGRVLSAGRPTPVVVLDETVHLLEGDPFGAWHVGPAIADVDSVRPLAPVTPSKIAAIGRNYRAHAEELGNDLPAEPLFFLKPPTAVVGPGDPIVLPPESSRVDHEAELAIVIGSTCRRVSEADAAAVVLGYTAGNDVTARDLQNRDGQWSRAKGFDSFCPLGPWIVPGMPQPDTLVECYVNDRRVQHGSLRDLVFAIPRLIAHVSAVMTLQPGDVILTGTPAGISPLLPGDVVRVAVTAVGDLVNPVVGP